MDNILYTKLTKEDVPELEITYGEPFTSMYYGAQYNYDFPIIYDLHRIATDRINLYCNDLSLRSNDDILSFKNNSTYILNVNSSLILINNKQEESKSNNRIIRNNLTTKNTLNLNLFCLSYFFKVNKEKNLLIKFNSAIYNVVPQLIYLYKSCFSKSSIFKTYSDNRLKDSFIFYGEDVIVDRVKAVKQKLKELLQIKREDEIDYQKSIKNILKPELSIYVFSIDKKANFNIFLREIYFPFLIKIRKDIYINLNMLLRSLNDSSKNINNKHQIKLKERLKEKIIENE